MDNGVAGLFKQCIRCQRQHSELERWKLTKQKENVSFTQFSLCAKMDGDFLKENHGDNYDGRSLGINRISPTR